MEIIKQLNENESQEAQDPLAILWGIYYSEIAGTGRQDSEYDNFKNIQERIKNNIITGKKGIEEGRAIVENRQE